MKSRVMLALLMLVVSLVACRRFIKASESRCKSSSDCSDGELCWQHPYTLVCDTEDGVVPTRGTCLPRECLLEGDGDARPDQLPIIKLKERK